MSNNHINAQNQSSSSNTSKSKSLHPIYVALDSHQYARAAKLASALPESHTLGQALLAYAQYKNGQPSLARDTILHGIFQWKEVTAKVAVEVATTTKTDTDIDFDWSLSYKDKPCPPSIMDETTLETIAITLSGIQKPQILFHMYAWVAASTSSSPSTLSVVLPKQFAAGISIFVQPESSDIHSKTQQQQMITKLSALALQLASKVSPRYQAWAAQTALWQYQLYQSSEKKDADNMRIQLLPRLAQSLATKVVDSDATTTTIEDCLLLLRTLQVQQKWNELLTLLSQDDSTPSKTIPIAKVLPMTQQLEWQVLACKELNDWKSVRALYLKLFEKSEQWKYLQGFINACCGSSISDEDNGYEQACRFVEEICSTKTRTSGLAECELALVGVQRKYASPDALVQAVMKYAESFCETASCVYSDLEPYLKALLSNEDGESIVRRKGLAVWASGLRTSSIQGDDKKDLRNKLRRITFATQVSQLVGDDSLKWKEIYASWKSFPTTTDDAQKENQPADELLILAVNQLLLSSSSLQQDSIMAATILETGLYQSSYNPNLKLRLLPIYASLQASDLSFSLYSDLGIKHIQVDSCSYCILDILKSGGMYPQAVLIANFILKFHISTLSDVSDFVMKAMEHGTWTKAEEFLFFQLNRMNPSVSLLDAKGTILDCAPLISAGTIAASHGIFGDDTDVERATQLLEQVHQHPPTGAPSMLAIEDLAEDYCVSDNRDKSLVMEEPTNTTDLIQAAMRRKFYHTILIRAAMILDVTKGPKKGKLVPASTAVMDRCVSLLNALTKNTNGLDDIPWVQATKILSQVLVITVSGMQANEEKITEKDSLQTRQDRCMELLDKATRCISSKSADAINDVGLLICNHWISVMAILKMTAKAFNMYGWGKRKQKIVVTSRLASFASTWKTLWILPELQKREADDESKMLRPLDNDVMLLLDMTIYHKVCSQVREARKASRDRLSNILGQLKDELDTFEPGTKV